MADAMVDEVAQVSAPPNARSVTRIASSAPHRQRLAQRQVGLRRAHRNDGDMRAVLVLETQRGLEAGLVVRVDDAGDAFTDQRSGHRIELDLVGIRDLLNANDYFQFLQLPSTSRTIRK